MQRMYWQGEGGGGAGPLLPLLDLNREDSAGNTPRHRSSISGGGARGGPASGSGRCVQLGATGCQTSARMPCTFELLGKSACMHAIGQEVAQGGTSC